VLATLDEILAAIPGLQQQVDRFGNRIVRLTRGPRQDCFPVFVAHLDHPGFLLEPTGQEASSHPAIFEGRVLSEFFPGSAVRLFRSATDEGVIAHVRTAGEEDLATDNRGIILESAVPVKDAVLAMWDVEPFAVRDGFVHARSCDDLAGCAAILAALQLLAEGTAPVDVAAVFSRAEEAGFCGVLCLLEEELPSLLSTQAVYISVENSSERPGVSCGDGAMIRLGDRMSTFDGPTADHLWRVAKANRVNARRMLMDGGTCEATVFARKGFRASGICIPLRNYHNMDRKSGKIAPEAISLADAEAVVQLIALYAAEFLSPAAVHEPSLDFDLFLRKGNAFLPQELSPAAT
jgi:putative aminopeptidase FrvX